MIKALEILARVRLAELTSQSREEAMQASFDMTQLGGMLAPDPMREQSTGLVEMQRLFSLLRTSGG